MRAAGPSGGAGVDVRLGLKDGRGSSAAVLVPQGRYVHIQTRLSLAVVIVISFG